MRHSAHTRWQPEPEDVLRRWVLESLMTFGGEAPDLEDGATTSPNPMTTRMACRSCPTPAAKISGAMASRRGEGFDHAGHQRQQRRRSREDDGGQHVGILAVDHNHRVALEQAPFLRTEVNF